MDTNQLMETIEGTHVVPIEGPQQHRATVSSKMIKQVRFFNGTGHDIRITELNGLSFTYPSDTSNSRHYSGHFVVEVYYEYKVSGLGCIEADKEHYLSRISESYGKEAKAIRDAFLKGEYSYSNGVVGIAYQVNISEFFDKKVKSLYIEPLDIVISLESLLRPGEKVVHPRSPSSYYLRQSESDVDVLSQRIEIFDPRGRFGDKYVMLAGRPFRIKAKKHSNVVEGVHVTTIGCADSGKNVVEYYTFDEAAKYLKLFNSEREAVAYATDTHELKREAEVFSLNNKKEQQALDYYGSRFDRDYKSLQDEKERFYKERDAALKQQADSIANSRKIAAEIFKWVPVVISLIALFAKQSGGKTTTTSK